jgi:rhamnogalacturonan endolyase
MSHKVRLAVVALIVMWLSAGLSQAARYMENLDRGVVAVEVPGSGVYVGWRMFGTDPESIAFNLYRDGVKINTSPITTSTNYMDAAGTITSVYYIRPVLLGAEQGASGSAAVWNQTYGTQTLRFKDVPIRKPADANTPDGLPYTYSANDCSVGDLDGDGEYEIVLKWDPSNAKDNPSNGYTGNVYLDAYELSGAFLWRIDLGINIRAGAHYTQFMVYDLDSDGRAEVACKTAPGTVDGVGRDVIMTGDDPAADYRDVYGKILTGPEYLTIFSGRTGAQMVTTAFPMPRGAHPNDWGDKSDTYGNRVDRFLACVAYLDGVHPSLVMCRGYYGPQSGWTKAKTQIATLDWRDGQLTQRWLFTATVGTGSDVNPTYISQGNHNLAVGDVDGDGYDEIMYGACAIDHDGVGLYSTGLGHGDAMHFGDLDPCRPGLEVFQCHESNQGASFRDAATGELIWHQISTGDNGRACSANLDPAVPGEQCWSTLASLWNPDGTENSTVKPTGWNPNFAIWWDADLGRELSDADKINKWNATTHTESRIFTVYNYGVSTNNGTKKNPCLQADILGDWREEMMLRTSDNSALRIFTPVTVTGYRIYTLMHDPVYRMGVAWQNVAYNQPPHTGFYLGYNMTLPAPLPNIYLCPNTLEADLSGDTLVNFTDMAKAAISWMQTDCSQANNWCNNADMDRSHRVDSGDLCIIADEWLTRPLGDGPRLTLVPGGEFSMGDIADMSHAAELPVHTVILDTFSIGRYEVTSAEYCQALNWAVARGLITVTAGVVTGVGNNQPYCDTTTSSAYSRIVWNGSVFSVTAGKDDHPMLMVTWMGAAAYCNWRSEMQLRQPCYNLSTWTCDFSKNGYHLPTEAQWEFAARGGLAGMRYPWGNTISNLMANTSISGDPYQAGAQPYTTPVAFYDGQLHLQADYGWPGAATSYQPGNAINGYQIYDMAGNVHELCNDWLSTTYYSTRPYPDINPTGPSTPTAGRVLRGGGWRDTSMNYCRVSWRDGAMVTMRLNIIGFRVAVDAP